MKRCCPKGIFYRLILVLFLQAWLPLYAQEHRDSTWINAQIEKAEKLMQSDPVRARETAEVSLLHAREQHYARGEIRSLSLLGNVMELRANLKQAVEYYWEALSKSEKAALDFEAACLRVELARCYRKLERLAGAYGYAKGALEFFEQQPNYDKLLTETLNELGMIYSDQGLPDKALFVYKRVLARSIRAKDTIRIAETYDHLGQVYLQKGEPRRALENHRKAVQCYQADRHQHGLMYTALNKYEVFRTLKQTDSARAMLDYALLLSRNYGFPDGEQRALYKLFEYYQGRENYQDALAYYVAYHKIMDSISYIEQRSQLRELEAAYEIRQREEAYRMLEEKNAVREQQIMGERILFSVLTLFFVAVLALAVLFYRNSSKIKRTNALLESQRIEILQQNERLRDINQEKDGIIGVVAHDLKSPLNKVEGFTQLIPLVGPLNQEQQSYIEQINKITAGGKRLIRDLLDIADIERSGSEVRVETFDLEQNMHEMVKSFEQRARQKSIRIEYEHRSPEVVANTDKSFLERILDNLVTNAIKFSQADTRIQIRSRITDQQICFEVRDQGPGISEEDQQKMFKKFGRLSAKPTAGEGSTGLGLSIIKALVEKLKGNIEVKSVLGEGTTFFVCLPQALS